MESHPYEIIENRFPVVGPETLIQVDVCLHGHNYVRIPMFAATEFSKLASTGMTAIVYDKTQVSLNKDQG